MASRSLEIAFSSSMPPCKHDVFLSFRGEDTRKTFVDHLYQALNQRGISTFKDDVKLERGKEISASLLNAIEGSRFAVIIFSKNYASSSWCLDELVKILECMKMKGQTVLPVFYHVNPTDVRKQRGSFEEALAKHGVLKENKDKVQRWRTALSEAGQLSGWDSRETGNGYEAQLIRTIVKYIICKLRHTYSSVVEDVDNVGLEARVEEVISLLDTGSNDTRTVGICGMGGIGKTTISKALYHRLSHQFDGSSYLANVREASNKHGLDSLQEQLLSEILPESDRKIRRDVDRGRSLIKHGLRFKRVLIVLDDVDHLNQLEALIGQVWWFGSGSTFIITTRDIGLLRKFEVNHVYEVKGLNNKEAVELFSRKAFKESQPKQGFERLTRRIVQYANGLPLALKVLGSYLRGRDVIQWQSELQKLRELPNADIQGVLKVSYDGLEYLQQKIFLDIACFFKGKSLDYVAKLMDACGFHPVIGISVLVERSLLTISNKKIEMHDLIQDMGRHIVNEESPEEPGRRSRLWSNRDIYHTLRNNTGTEAVEAIMLDNSQRKEKLCLISAETFSKMKKLRLLRISNVQLPHGLEYLSNELRLLDWQGCPLEYMPSNFQPDKVVELKVSESKYLKALPTSSQMNSLQILALCGCFKLQNILEVVWRTNCLTELYLDGTGIKELPIENLRNLVRISLEDCKNLTFLPSSACGLKFLEIVILSGCSNLNKLPEKLGEMESLEVLCVDKTAITQIPSSVVHLKKLEILWCHQCKGQSRPWNSFFSSFLMPIKNQDSVGLVLPPLSSLCSLKHLDLRDCNLSDGLLPSDLGCLASLEDLKLSNNGFVNFSATISGLSKLISLELEDCKKLKTMPELPSSIIRVNANGCTSLESLPNPSTICEMLQEITLGNCKRLANNSQPSNDDLPIKFFLSQLQLLTVWRLQEFTMVVPGREVPKCFSYQNNEGHSVRIQLSTPDWHKRLKGIMLCAIFAAKAATDIADGYVGCSWMSNEVTVLSTFRSISNYEGTPCFDSDHLYLHYLPFRSILPVLPFEKVDEELNTWTQFLASFGSYSPDTFAPIKCAAFPVYGKEMEWTTGQREIQGRQKVLPYLSEQDSGCLLIYYTKFKWSGWLEEKYYKLQKIMKNSCRKRSHHECNCHELEPSTSDCCCEDEQNHNALFVSREMRGREERRKNGEREFYLTVKEIN